MLMSDETTTGTEKRKTGKDLVLIFFAIKGLPHMYNQRIEIADDLNQKRSSNQRKLKYTSGWHLLCLLLRTGILSF